MNEDSVGNIARLPFEAPLSVVVFSAYLTAYFMTVEQAGTHTPNWQPVVGLGTLLTVTLVGLRLYDRLLHNGQMGKVDE